MKRLGALVAIVMLALAGYGFTGCTPTETNLALHCHQYAGGWVAMDNPQNNLAGPDLQWHPVETRDRWWYCHEHFHSYGVEHWHWETEKWFRELYNLMWVNQVGYSE